MTTPSTLPGSSELSRSVNELGFRLFEQLHQAENLVLSPVGVHVILSLLNTGARARTREILEQVVAADPGGRRLQEAFEAIAERTHLPEQLEKSLQQSADTGKREWWDGTATADDLRTILSSENSVWVQSGYPVHPGYADAVRDNVMAEVASVDFQREAAAACARVNDWVRRATRDKISEVIHPRSVPPLLRLLLVNAVYFKARWQSVFGHPEPGTFHPSDGEPMPASMMSRDFSSTGIAYHKDRSHLAVLLPFFADSLAMLVMMPKRRGQVGAEEFQQLWQKMEAQETRAAILTMPTFRVEGRLHLTETLASLGLGEALTPAADYTGISDERGLHPGAILQDTFVAVDRYGAEAAAVTMAAMIGASLRRFEPPKLVVDRPFLWAIVDRPLGLILFMGWVERPEAP